jgi:hypothetical protein
MRGKILLFIILLITFIFAFSPPSQKPSVLGWEEDVNLTEGMTVNNLVSSPNSNWATFTPNNQVYAVWYRTNPYQVIMRYWDQIGLWSPEETVSQGSFNFNEISSPSITGDSNNNIHFIWIGKISSPPRQLLFYRAKLADGNYTNICSLPTQTSATGNPHRSPKIAGGKGDTAHVVFAFRYDDNFFRIGYAKIIPTSPNPTVFPIEIISPIDWNYHSYYPHITVDGQNRIHVVWQTDFGGDIINHILYRMRDANGQWGPVETLSVFPNSYKNQYPRVAVDGNGNIHVVWNVITADINYSRIAHRVKTSSGWSEVTIFPQATSYNWYYPTCAVGPDNKLHIAFHTNSIGTHTNIARLLRDSSGNWELDAVTIFNDNYNREEPEIIVTPDGNIHIFRKDYASYTNNYYHIFYKRWTPSSGIKKGEIKIIYSSPTKISANLTIYNTLGEIIYSQKSNGSTINTKRLPKGIYLMKFNANEYKATRKLVIH